MRSHQHLGNSLSFERQRIGGERRYLVFSVFHPAERLDMIPSSAPPFFRFTNPRGIGYGMNSVGTAAIKKLGVICGFGGGRDKTRFIRFGRTLSLSLGATPQPIRPINTVSVPLTFDVNRYFKWLWKPSHGV